MAPRRPPPLDGSSGAETQVQRGRATKAHLHCFVRLLRLPIRSILPLRLCFFAERERSSFSAGAPDGWESARFRSIFLASSFFRSPAESTPAHSQVTQTVRQLNQGSREAFVRSRR